jgi:hypothetical protein
MTRTAPIGSTSPCAVPERDPCYLMIVDATREARGCKPMHVDCFDSLGLLCQRGGAPGC